MRNKNVRKQAIKTGYIKKFKFTFTNSEDWRKRKKLWSGYVDKLIFRRERDTLKIQKVIPYACPPFKPSFKKQPFNKDNQKTPPKSNKSFGRFSSLQ